MSHLITLLSDPQSWIALLTLTALELVLGIDNVVFISILASKLPAESQDKARKIGLGLALITRILLLFSISWVIGLTEPFFELPLPFLAEEARGISGRDIILLVGGLFLIWKSTHEIHQKLEGVEGHSSARIAPSFTSVIIQIMLLDIVFSLDSVITAVGMVDEVAIMITAVVIAVICMITFAGTISRFVEKHPTVKILALSFLLMIGATLIIESFEVHIPKGYIYFAMAFSVFVEAVNLRLRKSTKPVKLNEPYVADDGSSAS